MADIFVSYKAEDRRRIQQLVQTLQIDGYSVWWDEQIGGGDEWRIAIEQQLDAAQCVIVIWSKRSVGPEGRFVRDEASRAADRGVYLPVKIEDVRMPLGFGETQALALTGWRGNRSDPRYRAVLASVQRLVGQARSSDPSRGGQKRWQPGASRRGVIALAMATAVVAATGGWFLLKPWTVNTDSVVVLPFANLSGDPAQAYFSDGMAEEVRSALSRIPGLKVVARTSSEKVRDDDIQTAARKLSVSHVLTGSVRRSPSLIRVSVQLVDGNDGIERWSEVYDRPAGDALTVQSDIARSVAQALSIQLGRVQWSALTEGGTKDPTAEDLYLKADAVWTSNPTREGLTEAIKLLDSAIRVDPNFAEAYAKKGRAIRALTSEYSSSAADFSRGFGAAEAAAREALRRAPGLASAYATLASIRVAQLDFKAANAYFALASPSTSQEVYVQLNYANFVGNVGHIHQAVELSDRAAAIDPLNPFPIEIKLSILVAGRQYSDAVRVARDLLQWAPGRPITLYQLGTALLLLGQIDEARSAFARTPPDFNGRIIGEGLLAARTGDRAGSDRAIVWLRKTSGDASSYQCAHIYAQRGETELAFGALNRALHVRDPGLVLLPTDPFVDPLRSDPRFGQLVRQLNFPG